MTTGLEPRTTARHDETLPAMHGTLTGMVAPHPRELPPELARRLQRAMRLERLAGDQLDRRRRAIAGTGALILACLDAGWRQYEINTVLRLNRGAMHHRVKAARERHDDHAPALVVEPPPVTQRPVRRVDYLATPVAERDWLSRDEAATLLDVHQYSIRNYQAAGLLPNTRTNAAGNLYARSDLETLRDAPRYRGRGIHYAAARSAIAGD